MIIWIVWLGLRLRRPDLNWDDYAFFAVLLVCAGAYSFYLENTRRRGKGTVVTLDLSSRAASTGRYRELVDSAAASVGPGPMVAAHVPPAAERGVLAVLVEDVDGSGGGIHLRQRRILRLRASRKPRDFKALGGSRENNLPSSLLPWLRDSIVFAGIYREFQNRQLLRDGEATIGTIVDWIAGRRSSAVAVYQFWTRGGERFEHRSQVRSDKDEYSAPGPVPVFYLPEDPTKSLALCCTALRVRMPERRTRDANAADWNKILAAGQRDDEAKRRVRVGEAADLVVGEADGFSRGDDVCFTTVLLTLALFGARRGGSANPPLQGITSGISNRWRSLRGRREACASATGGAACAAPWLRSGECVRA